MVLKEQLLQHIDLKSIMNVFQKFNIPHGERFVTSGKCLILLLIFPANLLEKHNKKALSLF